MNLKNEITTTDFTKTSLKEIANLLGYNEEYLRKKCNELGFTKNGKQTMLDEKQFHILKQTLLPRTSDMNVRAKKIKTKIEILENYKKATEDLIDILEQEKQQLQLENHNLKIENQQLTAKQIAINEQTREKLKTKQAWCVVEKYIKLSAQNQFSFDYPRAHRYYYNEFRKLHPNIEQTINKAFFEKYPKYMRELLDIVIADDYRQPTDEEYKLFLQ